MTPKRLDWDALGPSGQEEALRRPRIDRENLREEVAAIISRVRADGDAALAELTAQFDGCRPARLAIEASQLSSAERECSESITTAIRDAEKRIREFHAANVPSPKSTETAPGVLCETRYQAIDPVGLYVPGGKTPLVSTVLMLGVPASLAGANRVVLCTPPGADGVIAPELLAAAHLCGISEVFAVGGAQAIAAMAYGSESIPRCNKIFGPGNAWVTEAKLQVSTDADGAAIDMPAGPSEVVVIADDRADPTSVAWDLLSQAEHGPDSQVVLITDSPPLAEAVTELLVQLAADLPRREILEVSLQSARIILASSLEQAVEISNRYAPEHLIVNTHNARALCEQVRHAGSVFIGAWTPESLGDYCSGTNHVLPTYGWARSFGALSVADFMRRYTTQQASYEGLRTIGPTAETLAAFEGLEAHRMAVRCRLDQGSPA
jgi:histidinol dehydrogenase